MKLASILDRFAQRRPVLPGEVKELLRRGLIERDSDEPLFCVLTKKGLVMYLRKPGKKKAKKGGKRHA